MAYFWADSGPVLWQNALRYISGSYLNDIGDIGAHVCAGRGRARGRANCLLG